MTGILALLAKGAGAVGAGRNWIGNTRAAIQRPAAEMRADIATRAQSKLAEMLQRQQEAAQQRQADQQAPGLAAALGRQAGPPRGGGQIGSGWDPQSDQAQAVGLMMDPGTRQLGTGMAAQLLDPAQRQALANSKLAGEATQQGMDQAAAAFPLEQAGRRQTLANQQLAAAKLRQDIAAGVPQAVTPYGEPPKGYFPVMNPYTQQPEYIPQPGTKPYNDAQAGTDTLQETVRQIGDLLLDIEGDPDNPAPVGATGTELTGPAATTLRFKRGNVISLVAQLRNLGVLQPAEFEAVDEQLPDPTSMARNIQALAAYTPIGLLTGGPDYVRTTITAPYRELLRVFEQRLKDRQQTYWYVRQESGLLPDQAGPPQ
jgi:hypothetical protein